MVSNVCEISVREYGTGIGDFQMVAEWFSSHREGQAFSETTLPPSGVIVLRDGEPVGACWMYLSAGIGVAYLEHAVTRPGQTAEEARETLGAALDTLTLIARDLNYGVLIADTAPAIARTLTAHHGFSSATPLVRVSKTI